MLPAGTYLEKSLEVEQTSIFEPQGLGVISEFFVIYGPGRTRVGVVHGTELYRLDLWRVMKKNNDLAFRRRINRYQLSKRKILQLRKNNPIKATYKRLRTELLCKQSSKQIQK